jgi:hypothetical protein
MEERSVPPDVLRPLWVTSFAADMYAISGAPLLASFRDQGTAGRLLACTEGLDPDAVAAAGAPPGDQRVLAVDLGSREFLRRWLEDNADIIPTHLGGREERGCQCPGGPYGPHDKRHRMPCVGQWFCRNASRWFRKMAALDLAWELARAGTLAADTLVWIDADCEFQQAVSVDRLWEWFQRGQADVFYLRSTRPVLEGCVVGYRIDRSGAVCLDWMRQCYVSKSYRGLQRWDDCYVLQKALERCPDVPRVDLAHGVGEHAAVVPYSALAGFIVHDKGRHSRGRGRGIMT